MIIGRSSILGGAGGAAGWVGKLLALQPSAYYGLQAPAGATTEPDVSGNNWPAANYVNNGGLTLGVADNPILSQPGLTCIQTLGDGWGGTGGQCLIPGHAGWRVNNAKPYSLLLWFKKTGGFASGIGGPNVGSWPEVRLSYGNGSDAITVEFSQDTWGTGLNAPSNQWNMLTVVFTATNTYFRVNKTEVAKGAAMPWSSYGGRNEFGVGYKAVGRAAHIAFWPGREITKAQSDALYDAATIVK